jgi:cytochrome c peroxidase
VRPYYQLLFGLLLVLSASADAQWSENELSILRSLSLTALPPVPASPSNRFANDSHAIALGKKVFFDPRFSANGKISCASCHQPEKYFTDQLKVGTGIQATQRNTPTVVASAWLRWFYWDGRRDSLWSQALIPFESREEMGSSRTRIIWEFSQNNDYAQLYQNIFGNLPTDIFQDNKPFDASPIGDAIMQDRWFRLSNAYKKTINTAFANIGKAIAAYERTLFPKPTRFDLYVEQLLGIEDHRIQLTSHEKQGISLFIDEAKTQCLQCHNGALLTNGGFHNIGTGNFDGERLDFGRMFGIQAVLIDEFNCLGYYSDADQNECHQLRFLNPNQHLEGAFKTPSLRNLKMTAPYFHDGRFEHLEEVLSHYNDPPTDNGNHEIRPMNLSDNELQSIAAFLAMLNEDD